MAQIRKLNKNSSLGKGIPILKSVESLQENLRFDDQREINVELLSDAKPKYYEGSSFVASNKVPSPYLRKANMT